MSIQEQIDSRLKDAMRAKDARTLNLVRMLKARMTEKVTSKGFSGEVDDNLWIEVIESYSKSLKKGIEQFAAGGAAAQDQIKELEWEVSQAETFLPPKADEATVRGWVEEAILGLGGKEKANAGRVMGAVLKLHKADADSAMVRRLAEELLKA